MMRIVKGLGVLVAGALFCLWCFAVAPLRAGMTATAQNRKAVRPLSPPTMALAKTLFEQNCARCHGADGRGKTDLGELYGTPDLTDAKQQRVGDKRLTGTIARGRGGMPSFAKKLSKEEIAALVAYVRAFKN